MKLPINCTVDYISDFLSEAEAKELYQILIQNYQLDQSRLTIEAGGRMIETDSFKILFTTEELKDKNSHPENIHGKSFVWAGPMAKLRERVENLLSTKFEIAMCIFYPDGNYFAPYHFDQQTSGNETILPSISLGEVRTFCFNENETDEIFSLDLANGSLLIMGAYCQTRYTHSLPQDLKYKNGRINITFRESKFQ